MTELSPLWFVLMRVLELSIRIFEVEMAKIMMGMRDTVGSHPPRESSSIVAGNLKRK